MTFAVYVTLRKQIHPTLSKDFSTTVMKKTEESFSVPSLCRVLGKDRLSLQVELSSIFNQSLSTKVSEVRKTSG